MVRTGEQRRDETLLWVGVGVAVVVVGLFAFLAGLYSNSIATSPPAFYAPFFPTGFPWIGGVFSLLFLFWVVSWFFRPWGWGGGLPAKVRVAEIRRRVSDTQRDTPRGR